MITIIICDIDNAHTCRNDFFFSATSRIGYHCDISGGGIWKIYISEFVYAYPNLVIHILVGYAYPNLDIHIPVGYAYPNLDMHIRVRYAYPSSDIYIRVRICISEFAYIYPSSYIYIRVRIYISEV